MPRCRTFALGLVAWVSRCPVPAEASSETARCGRARAGRMCAKLQRYLTQVGLRTEIDGQYGPHTSARVKSWERRSDRRVNGRVSRARGAQDGLPGRARRARVEPTTQPSASPPPAGEQATLGADGLAVAPASAPEEVKGAIAAGNKIASKPYKYGGGHGRWNDSGYDCSGAMSYALHGAGMLNRQLTRPASCPGAASAGRVGHDLRQHRPRLPEDRRPALRHRLEQRRQGPALERADAPDRRLRGQAPQRPLRGNSGDAEASLLGYDPNEEPRRGDLGQIAEAEVTLTPILPATVTRQSNVQTLHRGQAVMAVYLRQ